MLGEVKMTGNGDLPRIGIVGGGRLAQAMAGMLQRLPTELGVWSRKRKSAETVSAISKRISVYDELSSLVDESQILALALPAHALNDVVEDLGSHARPDQLILHGMRGVDGSGRLPHQILKNETCLKKIAVVGGPLLAPEVDQRLKMTAMLASAYPELIDLVIELGVSETVHLHRSSDVAGFEVIGAMSNVTATAVGMVAALGGGETARGVVMMHGLTEAAYLGSLYDAKRSSFSGLAGIGDMLPRKITSTSRHHKLGKALVDKSGKLTNRQRELDGVWSARHFAATGDSYGLPLRLCNWVASALSDEPGDLEAQLKVILSADIALDDALGRLQ